MAWHDLNSKNETKAIYKCKQKFSEKKQRKIREKSEIKKASSKQAFRQDHRQDLRAIIWNAILAVSWRCVSGTRVAGSGGVAVALVEKWIIPKLRG
ncbi:MAG TPA: hypothetical protein PK702_11650 [Burkholderiaceae bacterium]|nr:hypothetical protein [Burkholderiaceae bacterium]